MNGNAIARHYARLTPEERFRLILAASGRGDETVRQRLVNAGGRIDLSVSDHAPYGLAFVELANLFYIDLLEAAACYRDAFGYAADAGDIRDDDEAERQENNEKGDDGDEPDAAAATDVPGDDNPDRPLWLRAIDLTMAAGYMLRTRADGWHLFCERLDVPPHLLWERLPGFDRLERAVATAEKVAFTPEGYLRWLNMIRPKGEAELSVVPRTPANVADATSEMHRQHAARWAGSPGENG
jgi:hypothetical protein